MRKERTLRWTLASDRFSRNNFCQQASLCLAFCRRVFYLVLDILSDVYMHIGCLRAQLPVGDYWADWRNTSGQQPSLSLAFCKHVFYVIHDRMVRCARGFSPSLGISE